MVRTYKFRLKRITYQGLLDANISTQSGGWQNLVRHLRALAEVSSNITLDGETYRRLVRYAKGKGGYQKIFQAVLDCEVAT